MDEQEFYSDKNNNAKTIITEKNEIDKIFKDNKIKVCVNYDEKINDQNKGKSLNTFKQIKQKKFEERNSHFSNENSDPISDLKINLNSKKKNNKVLRAFHFTNEKKI